MNRALMPEIFEKRVTGSSKGTNFTKYVEYIINCGEKCHTFWFDDDWDPVGPTVRANMVKAGLIEYDGDRIVFK